jgi:fructokinase
VRTEDPTTLALAELGDGGSVSRYRFYAQGTSAAGLTSEAALLALPERVATVFVGTLGLVLEPMATTLETIVDGVGDDVLVLLDPNCRPRVTPDRTAYLARLDRMLARADVVKVSTDDLEFISPGDHGAGVRMLLDRGAPVVLHTDGGRSVHIRTADGEQEIAVPVVQVADTIGAGDAFGGAFVAWWDQARLGRRDVGDAVALRAAVTAATQVAAISCTRVGAQPPRRDELGTRWSPAAV